MKSTTTITLDTELIIALRNKGINISGLFNSYLKEFLNIKEEKKETKLSKLNLEILKEETKLLEKKKQKEEIEKEIEKHKGEFLLPDGSIGQEIKWK